MGGAAYSLSTWFASSCILYLAVYLFKMGVFERHASEIKSLLPGIYTIP